MLFHMHNMLTQISEGEPSDVRQWFENFSHKAWPAVAMNNAILESSTTNGTMGKLDNLSISYR